MVTGFADIHSRAVKSKTLAAPLLHHPPQIAVGDNPQQHAGLVGHRRQPQSFPAHFINHVGHPRRRTHFRQVLAGSASTTPPAEVSSPASRQDAAPRNPRSPNPRRSSNEMASASPIASAAAVEAVGARFSDKLLPSPQYPAPHRWPRQRRTRLGGEASPRIPSRLIGFQQLHQFPGFAARRNRQNHVTRHQHPQIAVQRLAGMQKNRWRARAGESVAEIFRPINPDLPMPVTTTRPLHANSTSTAIRIAHRDDRSALRSLRTRSADTRLAVSMLIAGFPMRVPTPQAASISPPTAGICPSATRSLHPTAPSPDRRALP